jgi:hypothetical protein
MCNTEVAWIVDCPNRARFARRTVSTERRGANRAFSDGSVAARQGRTPATTTPTQFEDFAADLAVAYTAA